MASDSFSRILSHPETDGREARQESQECDTPGLQIAPPAYPLTRKQIVGTRQPQSPEYDTPWLQIVPRGKLLRVQGDRYLQSCRGRSAILNRVIRSAIIIADLVMAWSQQYVYSLLVACGPLDWD